jgi:hypothetical protein
MVNSDQELRYYCRENRILRVSSSTDLAIDPDF